MRTKTYKCFFFRIFLAVFVMSSVMMLTSCRQESMTYEEWYEMTFLWRKGSFGRDLMFEFQMFQNGERNLYRGVSIPVDVFNPLSTRLYDPFYTDLIFVHNEEEAKDFPENVIVAWPNVYATESAIFIMDIFINRTEEEIQTSIGRPLRPVLNLEDFGLSYPLTVANFVDDWEKVHELWQAFTSSEQGTIASFARNAAFRNEVLTDW